MIARSALEHRELPVSSALLDTVTKHFAELDDPRRETANRRHEFIDILTIALCAVIGGANLNTSPSAAGGGAVFISESLSSKLICLIGMVPAVRAWFYRKLARPAPR